MNEIDRGTHLSQGSTFLGYMRFKIASLKKESHFIKESRMFLFNSLQYSAKSSICPNISLFYENS